MFAFSEATSVLRQSLPFQESVRFGANKVVPQPQVLPLGCDGRVLQVAFAANGRTLAAGGDEGKVVLWDLPSGQVVMRLPRLRGSVRALGFSADGRLVATAGGDWLRQTGELKLWNLSDGRSGATLWANDRPITAVAFSPDGRWLAAGDGLGTVRIWDLVKNSCSRLAGAHEDEVLSIGFSPDAQRLVTTAADHTVHLSDLSQLPHRTILRGHTGVVWGFSFSPSGECLATAGADGTVRLWTAATGKERGLLAGHQGPVRAVTFGATEDLLFAAEGPKEGASGIRVWQPWEGTTGLLAPQSATIFALTLSPDGQTLAGACRDSKLLLWSWAAWQEWATPRCL